MRFFLVTILTFVCFTVFAEESGIECKEISNLIERITVDTKLSKYNDVYNNVIESMELIDLCGASNPRAKHKIIFGAFSSGLKISAPEEELNTLIEKLRKNVTHIKDKQEAHSFEIDEMEIKLLIKMRNFELAKDKANNMIRGVTLALIKTAPVAPHSWVVLLA